MDPYSKYKKELEYYQYLEKQRENYVDMTGGIPMGHEKDNSSIKLFANVLFNKKENNLNQNLSGILVDETMQSADIFCMLVELILYGINILTSEKTTIFGLDESTSDIVYTIKSYLKSTGFDMIVSEDFVENNEVYLYRDHTDYYCEIVKKPPKNFCYPGWYVLVYRLINNNKFKFANITPLEKFKAFFISDNKKIFTISFMYANK